MGVSMQGELPDELFPLPQAEDEVEAARQLVMQRWLREVMGGLIPEQPDLSHVQRVLDVACGAGAWAIELASTFPHLQVSGIEHRPFLIDYARALAWERGLTNVTFSVGDIRGDVQKAPQEEIHPPGAPIFSPGAFDLIDMAFVPARIHTRDYPGLIRNLWHLCHPGGVLRWTESDMPATTSPALATLAALFSHAVQAETSWHFPCEHRFTLTHLMGRWLRDAGFERIRYFPYVLDASAGTPAHPSFFRQVWVVMRQARSFLIGKGVITAEAFEALSSQVQRELHEQFFCGLCLIVTVRGEKGMTKGQNDAGD
jgi:SAM-dependent methyltransferase